MKSNRLSRFAIPYVIWMALFVVAPIIMVVIYAFSASVGGFTLDNFAKMGTYTVVFTRSFKLALIATAICVFIGYPVSYKMSKEGPRFQRLAMVLIMLPMWINFLLRTYSWMAILENNGLLNQLFRKIGLIALYNNIFGTDISFFRMINTQGAVVLGMVYNYALHDPAYLFRDRQAGPQSHRGGPGSGCQLRSGVPAGDPAPVPPRCALRHHHGIRPLRVHLCHQQNAGRRYGNAAG